MRFPKGQGPIPKPKPHSRLIATVTANLSGGLLVDPMRFYSDNDLDIPAGPVRRKLRKEIADMAFKEASGQLYDAHLDPLSITVKLEI